jgi:hypothetical protein
MKRTMRKLISCDINAPALIPSAPRPEAESALTAAIEAIVSDGYTIALPFVAIILRM